MTTSLKLYLVFLDHLLTTCINTAVQLVLLDHCGDAAAEMFFYLMKMRRSLRLKQFNEVRTLTSCALSYAEKTFQFDTGTKVANRFQKTIISDLKFILNHAIHELTVIRISEEIPECLELFRPKIEPEQVTFHINHAHIIWDTLEAPPEYLFAEADAEMAELVAAAIPDTDSSSDTESEEEDMTNWATIPTSSFYNAQFIHEEWAPETIDYRILLYSLRHEYFDFARAWIQVTQTERNLMISGCCTLQDTYDAAELQVVKGEYHPGDFVSWYQYFSQIIPHSYNYNSIHRMFSIIFNYSPYLTWNSDFVFPNKQQHPNIFIDHAMRQPLFWHTKELWKLIVMQSRFDDVPMTFSML